jgi:2,4-dienoyl-CoA reductase-like NADH-dependent reductase (Old Yellow Enzyme family)/thioredoxin reductase
VIFILSRKLKRAKRGKPMDFKRLFEPYQLSGLTLKNRLISAPCERNYANIDGSVTQQYIDYVVERAKGGVGLIIVESMYIEPKGRGHLRQLGIYDDTLIPGLRRMTDSVHDNGAKVASELMFTGRQTSSYITGFQPVAPSNVPCTVLAGGEAPRELTIAEIHGLIDSFGEAARRSVEAGFDLIEIHGAHGYIINQFLSPFTNKRTDEYGGSFEKRCRFPLEVVAKAREAVGNDVPIAYRMSADEKIEGGLTIDDMVRFSRELEKAGIDLIDVSAGIYESVVWIAQPMAFPRGCLVDLGWKIREKVNIPVSIVGRINHPELAEKILADGKADFISLGRALHADPYWPLKAQEGRVEDIRICPACMSCSDQLGTNLPITCAINPEAGRERELAIKPAPKRKRVLVVGAGPSGMEAARVVDLRGHQVILCEKQDRVGGQLHYASRAHHKKEFKEVIRFLEVQLKKSHVDMRLGTEVTPSLVQEIKPDAVIIATGATSAFLFTPGADKPHVHSAIDVLDKRVSLDGKIAIIGGGLVGLETALFILENGVSPLIIVEPTDKLGGNVGLRTGWFIRSEVANQPDIEVRMETTVEAIGNDSIIVQQKGKFEELRVKNVVLAVGMRNNNTLAEELRAENAVEELYIIGDCNIPRTMKEAFEEAAIAARRV